MAERRRSFAVIGLGAFGSTIATELSRMGGHVLGIDTAERRVARIADQISEAKILDGSDEDALREAGLGRFRTVVVAIGENVEGSILSTMNARGSSVARPSGSRPRTAPTTASSPSSASTA